MANDKQPLKITSAFPFSVDNGATVKWTSGMSLRDYFAAKMIQANYMRNNLADGYMDKMCQEAYEYADAMMKAREKNGE